MSKYIIRVYDMTFTDLIHKQKYSDAQYCNCNKYITTQYETIT